MARSAQHGVIRLSDSPYAASQRISIPWLNEDVSAPLLLPDRTKGLQKALAYPRLHRIFGLVPGSECSPSPPLFQRLEEPVLPAPFNLASTFLAVAHLTRK